MDNGAKTKRKIFHPYIAAACGQVETWLSQMAQQGWKLVDMKRWTFVFIPCKPQKKEYVVFVDVKRGNKNGDYRDFLTVKELCGKRNDNDSFFEVNLNKDASEVSRFRAFRKRSYRRYFRSIFYFSICCMALLFLLSAPLPAMIYVGALFLPHILYHGISLLLLHLY